MAKIFRLQENVPDVYARKSRDFQLLCNVFDILQGGIKYDIDTITSVVDTRYCSERLLPLLQSKLGFFTEKHLNASELRAVLTSFYQLCRDKGSLKGIREAIELYLKVIGASRKSRINVTNAVREPQSNRILHNSSYIVEVLIEGQITDVTLLTELLRYVLPAGYILSYSFYQSLDAVEYIIERGTINVVIVSSAVNNRVVGYDSNNINEKLMKYIFATGDVNKDENYYVLENAEYVLKSYDEITSADDATSYIKQCAEFTELKYGDICDIQPEDTAQKFIDSVDSTNIYKLHKQTSITSIVDQISSADLIYDEGNMRYFFRKVVANEFYSPTLVYYNLLIDPTTQEVTNVEIVDYNTLKQYLVVDSTDINTHTTKQYYKGQDLNNQQSYNDLIRDGIIANLFTTEGASKIYTKYTDGVGVELCGNVEPDSEYYSTQYYYTTESNLAANTTQYEDLVPGVVLYELTTNVNKMINENLIVCKCIYNETGSALDTSETYYYVDDSSKVGYVFKADQNKYYILDTTVQTLPSAVSTSLIADVATTQLPAGVLTDKTPNTFEDSQAQYILEHLGMSTITQEETE